MAAAQQHIELIARIFAETGMKQLYKIVLHLLTTHQDQPRMVRLTNEFVPIDPKGMERKYGRERQHRAGQR